MTISPVMDDVMRVMPRSQLRFNTSKSSGLIETAAGQSDMAYPTDIHVNAISPVAATRVLRGSAPELAPDLVAPGVAFLASSACAISGAVLNAAGGRFSAAWWDRGEGIDLGPAPASPEEIADRWQQIAARPRAPLSP
jgi:hypothetical protein